MKKITYLLTATIFMFYGIISTLAFDNSIELSENIKFNTFTTTSNNYVSLYNDLKNDNTKVYSENIEITQEQFNTIKDKKNGLNNYVKEQSKIIKEKAYALAKEAEQINAMNKPAGYESIDVIKILENDNSDNTITSEQYESLKQTEYAKAYLAYLQHKKEYNQYVTTFNSNVEQKEKELKSVIPSFDNTKWEQLKLLETSELANRYTLNMPKTSYAVVWIKASLNNNDYYNVGIYCAKEAETIEEPKIPEEPKTPEDP